MINNCFLSILTAIMINHGVDWLCHPSWRTLLGSQTVSSQPEGKMWVGCWVMYGEPLFFRWWRRSQDGKQETVNQNSCTLGDGTQEQIVQWLQHVLQYLVTTATFGFSSPEKGSIAHDLLSFKEWFWEDRRKSHLSIITIILIATIITILIILANTNQPPHHHNAIFMPRRLMTSRSTPHLSEVRMTSISLGGTEPVEDV